MERDDRERLIGFVYATREDLPFIFDSAGQYIAPEVSERLWPAWEALLARNEFEALADAITSSEFDAGLDRAGLSGPELDFKLTGVDTARRAGRETRGPRRLKRWLAWIDVILGSLLSVIPGGDSIKELKEGVEAELEPDDESGA